MLEKQIEKAVCDYAKTKGFLVYKFTSPSRAAVPDRMFIRNGVVSFIEFKAEGQKATPAQHREHHRLQGEGMSVFMVDNIGWGKTVVDSLP